MTALIVALDTDSSSLLESELNGHVNMFKYGPVSLLQRHLVLPHSFIDLKLHDTPETVSRAIIAMKPHYPMMLTIHALGGREMIQAARKACDTYIAPPLLIAVTVLTSLDNADMSSIGMHSHANSAVRLAYLAHNNGADGIVCSGYELDSMRSIFMNRLKYVVPGIRIDNTPGGGQKRVSTPQHAVSNGADYIVVGRPITQATDPVSAAMEFQLALKEAERTT